MALTDTEIRRSKPTRKTNMARVDAKELPTLLRAIEVFEGRQLTRLAIKLMALTFVRTSELIGARWEEFDIEAKRWSIPATRMKMKTPHIVPVHLKPSKCSSCCGSSLAPKS